MDTDTSTSFTEHIKCDHETETHLKCRNCKIRSHETSNMNGHNRMVHENKNEHHCNSCDKVYKLKNCLTRHIKNVHKKQGKAQIEHCNTTNTEEPIPRKHDRAGHNNVKEHYCNICEKTYKYKSSLERHIKNIHENETSVKHKHQKPKIHRNTKP